MSLRKSRIALLRLSFLPLLPIALFVGRTWSDSSWADYALDWGGYLLILAGVLIRFWATLYIGARKSVQLVEEGPYSLCRNPLYLGTLVIVVGVALCLESVVLLLALLLFYVPLHLLVVRDEERRLAQRFGEPYARYCAAVSRFWPSWAHFRSSATLAVSLRAIRRGAIELVCVLLIPPLADLVEHLHHLGLLPVLWRPF